MRTLKCVAILIALSGCNSQAPGEIGGSGTQVTLASTTSTTQPKTSTPATVTPSPSPTSAPIVKYDPFDGKYGHRILIQDSSGTTTSSLDLFLPKLSGYSANGWGHGEEVWFVYNRDVNTTSYVGCRSNWVALQDSDTNTHKLTIRAIEQTNAPQFVYGYYLMDFGADFSSWFYNSTSECQDLYGVWDLTIEPSDSTYNLMTKS